MANSYFFAECSKHDHSLTVMHSIEPVPLRRNAGTREMDVQAMSRGRRTTTTTASNPHVDEQESNSRHIFDFDREKLIKFNSIILQGRSNFRSKRSNINEKADFSFDRIRINGGGRGF